MGSICRVRIETDMGERCGHSGDGEGGWVEKAALTWVTSQVRGSQPVGSCSAAQGAQLGALCRPRRWDEGCEGGSKGRECKDAGLIHFVVQQKLTEYCKATIPQKKKKKCGNLPWRVDMLNVIAGSKSVVRILSGYEWKPKVEWGTKYRKSHCTLCYCPNLFSFFFFSIKPFPLLLANSLIMYL